MKLTQPYWAPRPLDGFTVAYVEAALFYSADTFASLDDGEYELADATVEAIIADCAQWQEANAEALAFAYEQEGYSGPVQAGHDFFLTRNRHGAGFWDRGLNAEYPTWAGSGTSNIGEHLTDSAHAEGSADLYIGDDGLIYQS